jgi:ATP-dependent helicase/nuclease subunit B
LFIEWEASRARNILQSLVELKAEAPVGKSGFLIRCRADRIDRLENGAHVIIDYKTGLSPSPKQAGILLAPQLPLEGALALRGAFDGVIVQKIDDLLYVRLRVDEALKVDSIGGLRNLPDAHEISLKAWQALEGLVEAYQDLDKGYLSRARPFKQGDFSGDYDHLARVLEWSVGDEEAIA